ncbi:L,D-transpeptidase [Pedobacter kyonggii]|uniref:L,D-transpeptidase n=2 Tax=Pedobacter kyonggii TaxID=1926871 RepID=A0A4Q9HG20_9SPHI|nr:L,D-transpeptidase [Pedobacter kyonggii]
MIQIIIYNADSWEFYHIRQFIMKTQNFYFLKNLLRRTIISCTLLCGFSASVPACAPSERDTNHSKHKIALADSTYIKIAISQISPRLNYPKLVERFYKNQRFSMIWVKPDTVKSEIYKSMLLMDCVLQFGLNRDDFHPGKLTYNLLKPLVQAQSNPQEKSNFDVYLTDALITLVNHLHYGKFNPVYISEVLEEGKQSGFDPVAHLTGALHARDFMEAVVSAQPKMQMYRLLQDYLHLVKGQYIDDCYEFPEGDARKMAINMERMRWINSGEEYYIHINIPSYSLKLLRGDSIILFKTVVGKPSTPTPELESQVNYMTTAPEWKVPQKIFAKELLPKALKDSNYLKNNHYGIYDLKGNYIVITRNKLQEISAQPGLYLARQSPGCDNALGKIVFRFPNRFDIYLHDTPEQKLFKKESRSFSHGCVRVENADRLAKLLLEYDGAVNRVPKMNESLEKMQRRNFTLTHPVPIKITYFTCEIDDGMFRSYPDIYKRDAALEQMMFPSKVQLAEIKK